MEIGAPISPSINYFPGSNNPLSVGLDPQVYLRYHLPGHSILLPNRFICSSVYGLKARHKSGISFGVSQKYSQSGLIFNQAVAGLWEKKDSILLNQLLVLFVNSTQLASLSNVK
jgi:hypothetical protein